MSNRTFRAATEETMDERAADAAASTGHLSIAADGAARGCFCSIETEHDRETGQVLTVEAIANRKRGARPTLGQPITTDTLGIAGKVTPERIARITSRYAETPVFDPDVVPRGRYAHIGGGIWLRRCRECDDYVRSYGSVAYLYPFARHEASHGVDVAGYNTPMLASA